MPENQTSNHKEELNEVIALFKSLHEIAEKMYKDSINDPSLFDEEQLETICRCYDTINKVYKPTIGSYMLCTLGNTLHQSIKQASPNSKKREVIQAYLDVLFEGLRQMGFEIIGGDELIGQPIDASLHQCVEKVPATDEYPAGSIVEFIAYGIKLDSHVIQSARVIIAVESNQEG